MPISVKTKQYVVAFLGEHDFITVCRVRSPAALLGTPVHLLISANVKSANPMGATMHLVM